MEPARKPDLVSVIIPCFNGARFIREAVQSALAQTYRPIEIVVINDGSTDAFDEAVAPVRSQIIVINQVNAGLAASRNRGIAAASDPEFVAFLDADDVWEPNKIQRQVVSLQSRPECVLAHTAVACIGPTGAEVDRPAKPWHERRLEGFCTLDLLAHNTITVSSVVVRRAALGRPAFVTDVPGCEDWNLWLRLSLTAPFLFIDEPLTRYRMHDSNMSSNVELMQGSVVDVLENALKEDLSPEIRRSARRHWLAAVRAFAHVQYDKGNLREARRQFARAIPVLGPRDFRRFLLTLLPPRLASLARDSRRQRASVE